MAKRKSQSEHDRMVKIVADYLVRERHRNVKADAPGYPRPTEISWKGQRHGHIPDVTTDEVIVEVETADSIDDPHTEDQWKLFGAFAIGNNKTFIVVVPEGTEAAARRRLRELGVTAKVWTV